MNEGVPFPVPAPVSGEGDGGKVLQTLQWFSGKGRAFLNSSMALGDGEKQNESIVFQCFPRLTPDSEYGLSNRCNPSQLTLEESPYLPRIPSSDHFGHQESL